MKTLSVHTLGCRINRFDSSAVLEAARAAGYEVRPDAPRADVLVINTCTVTAAADAEGRRLARRLRRANPEATIVVTGCSAQTRPEALAALPEIDYVLGAVERGRLCEILAEREASGRGRGSPATLVGDLRGRQSLDLPGVARFQGRARALLKVQDGCNARCSYCVIPAARGRSRSAPVDQVRARVREYAEAGHPEVTLAGVHLGAYGRDLPSRATLAGLVRSVLADPAAPYLRLSSVEPTHFTDDLVAAVSEDPRACPHFHLPLQSGSDAVLRRMRRGYTASRYRERVERLLRASPRAAVGADVLAGFPGESNAEFEETLRLIEDLPLAYLHVFPYSEREGTAAARGEEGAAVASAVVRDRAARLRALGEAKRRRYWRARRGERLTVFIEGVCREAPGWVHGTSAEYVPIALRGPERLVGRAARAVAGGEVALAGGALAARLADGSESGNGRVEAWEEALVQPGAFA